MATEADTIRRVRTAEDIYNNLLFPLNNVTHAIDRVDNAQLALVAAKADLPDELRVARYQLGQLRFLGRTISVDHGVAISQAELKHGKPEWQPSGFSLSGFEGLIYGADILEEEGPTGYFTTAAITVFDVFQPKPDHGKPVQIYRLNAGDPANEFHLGPPQGAVEES